MTAPRVLVAPDSFKGTMSATTVATAICDGVRDAGGDPVSCPVADGGEGTIEVIRSALGGQLVTAPASSPLGQLMDANFLLLPDRQTAVVETATASGLTLLDSPGPHDAWQSSSAGTGDLIAAAVDAGATWILLGVGGSACTDGGAGAIAAITERCGLRGSHLVVLCDVQTAFEESATVYRHQKGADEATITWLTTRLNRLAETFPGDPRGRAATGAAGGPSGGLWAAFGATLIPAIDEILDRLLGGVDAVITGEGRLDSQTLHGKVIDGVTRRAASAGVPAVGHRRSIACHHGRTRHPEAVRSDGGLQPRRGPSSRQRHHLQTPRRTRSHRTRSAQPL